MTEGTNLESLTKEVTNEILLRLKQQSATNYTAIKY